MYIEFLIPLIPVAWLLFSRYWLRNTISIAEMLIGMVLIVGTAGSLYYFTLFTMKLDYQLLNGQIESKEKKYPVLTVMSATAPVLPLPANPALPVINTAMTGAGGYTQQRDISTLIA